LPKASLTCHSITTKKIKHWSIDVQIENRDSNLPTNKNRLRINKWHKSVIPFSCQPHVATWSTKKENSFSHITHQPKHDNLCLQRSSKWNIWWMSYDCMFDNFLSLSDSKKVFTVITIFKNLPFQK
jgi:hypothetical protein